MWSEPVTSFPQQPDQQDENFAVVMLLSIMLLVAA